MAKTASVYARIDPEIKEHAEKVLSDLGLSSSTAIDMFYRQVILHQGIPFDLSVNNGVPNVDSMTQAELKSELDKAEQNVKKGKVFSIEELEKFFDEKYGI